MIFFIALRYIFGKTLNRFSRCIYWISSASIMFSMVIIILVLSIMNGFESNLKRNVFYFTPHMIVTATQGYANIKDFPDFLLCKSILKNILYVKPLVMSDVILQSVKTISFGLMLGTSPKYFEPLSKYLINKQINHLVSGKYNVVIGSALAKQLAVKINDQIRLIIPSINQITPFGYLLSQRLFTISDIYISNNEIDNYQILVHQDDAANLMHYPKQCVTGWRIWLRDPFKLDDIIQLHISKDWILKDWREYQGSLFQAIKIEKNVMCLLFILIIMIAGFNIISFLVLSIINKQKEVAIFKTCGLTRFRVMLFFIIQSIIHGTLGIVLGIGLGICLSKKLNQILCLFNNSSNMLQFFVEIRYLQILIISIMIIILIILISLYPAWKAASICPARVLHYD